MSRLKQIRELQNLTQEELAQKTGISVRTIQRIEAGTKPKGYTLKTLVHILQVSESDLLEDDKTESTELVIETSEISNIEEENSLDYKKIKLINLSSILFILLPPLNIIAPLLLSHFLKQKNELIRQIVSVQIIWTILAPIVFFIGIFFKLGHSFTLVLIIGIILSNLFIILSNTSKIDKEQKLRYRLNFNLL